jgi:hypothetical protein
VGYSLSDTPITSLLLSSPGIRDKTTFVVREVPDERYKRQVERYGSIRTIAISGFASHLRGLSAKPRQKIPERFSAFEEMNPTRDKKILSPPTAIEVRNLFTIGTFSRQSCAAIWPSAGYTIPRLKKIEEAVSALATTKTLLLHARMGNGKTVFCEMLALSLADKNWRCIRAKALASLTDDDLILLNNTPRLAVFFRSIDDAIQIIKQIPKPRSDSRFIVEERLKYLSFFA